MLVFVLSLPSLALILPSKGLSAQEGQKGTGPGVQTCLN